MVKKDPDFTYLPDLQEAEASASSPASLKQHLIYLPLSLGLLLVLVGGVFLMLNSQEKDVVEIIPVEEKASKKTIFVDLQGAVIKKGVYEMPFGSRIDDLLIKAGGLSAAADREYLEKNLNRAQKLTDGQKIYIPETGETKTTTSASNKIETVSQQVNINTATQKELEALPGIGTVTAEKIIKNRPYSRVEDLLTGKILSNTVYNRLVSQLTVF